MKTPLAFILAMLLIAVTPVLATPSTVTCEDAIAQGLLNVTISNGSATITNNGATPYFISVASYEMNSLTNVSFSDSHGEAVPAGMTKTFGADYPLTNPLVFVVCDKAMKEDNPSYPAQRVVAFSCTGPFCPQQDNDSTSPVNDTPLPEAPGNETQGNQDNQSNETQTNETQSDEQSNEQSDNSNSALGVVITIAPSFPQGGDFVFVCNAQGFSPDAYDWDFGDGEKLYDLPASDVYHHYKDNGHYVVTCSPSESAFSVTGLLELNVTTAHAAVLIAPSFPQHDAYVFICDTTGLGFTPAAYDWSFGDGEQLIDVSNGDVFHTFAPGNYTVACTATGNEHTVIGWTAVSVACIENSSLHVGSDTGADVLGADNAAVAWQPTDENDHSTWDSQLDTPVDAQWIWSAYTVADPINGELHTFRKTFRMSGEATSATLKITAVNGYEAWLNGGLVGSAQVSGNWKDGNLSPENVAPDGWQTVESYDVASQLVDGENVLVVVAASTAGGDNATAQSNPAGVIFTLDVDAHDARCAPEGAEGVDGNGTNTSAEQNGTNENGDEFNGGSNTETQQSSVSSTLRNSGRGGCATGWSWSGGACVKDEHPGVVPLGGTHMLSASTTAGDVLTQSAPDAQQEESSLTGQGSDNAGNSITGNVITAENSARVNWIFVLVGLIVIAAFMLVYEIKQQ